MTAVPQQAIQTLTELLLEALGVALDANQREGDDHDFEDRP
jgi:hypothetical protein